MVNGARAALLGLCLLMLAWGTGCAADGALHGGRARVIEGRGVGLPAADAATPDQKVMTARRAAYYRALADLVGKVYGTRIKGESKVVNMQFAGESVQAGVTGVLEGVQVLSNEYDPKRGVATAVVQVEVDRAGRIIPVARPPHPADSAGK